MNNDNKNSLDMYIAAKKDKINFEYNSILQDLKIGKISPLTAIKEIKELCYNLKIILQLHMLTQLRVDITNLLSIMSQTIIQIENNSKLDNENNLNKDDDLIK